MTKDTNDRNRSYEGLPFDPESLKLESLQYLLLDKWMTNNIAEVPSARLTLKTAYLFYLRYCDAEGIPCVPIQSFNRVLTELMSSRWPMSRRRRTARGTLYENMTLRDWVPKHQDKPLEGQSFDSLVIV